MLHPKRFLFLTGIIILFLLAVVWGKSYLIPFLKSPLKSGQQIILNQQPTSSAKAGSSIQDNFKPVDYQIQLVAENLYVPWSLEFTSRNRILVSERNGAIREIVNGQLVEESLITFSEVSTQSEEGLMGLTKDPDYQTNGWLYACLAYPQGNQIFDKVVRFQDPIRETRNSKLETILDHIPATQFHAGCRLKFGPDKKLYITTGDATDKDLAQNMSSLAGKILRINADGSVPADSPYRVPIYSFGHRNPQGLAWHPTTGQLWSTEHGPSGFDGPGGGDEVNLIIPYRNYGWPIVSHEKSQSGLVSPKLVFTPAEAPASAMFYSGDLFPQFQNNLFFGALKGEGIVRIILSADNPEEIFAYEKLDLKGLNPGRIREVAQGPDGAIYFTTSNRDGRGDLRPGDDKIYKIIP